MAQSHLSINQESEGSLVEKLPDGNSVLAITEYYYIFQINLMHMEL